MSNAPNQRCRDTCGRDAGEGVASSVNQRQARSGFQVQDSSSQQRRDGALGGIQRARLELFGLQLLRKLFDIFGHAGASAGGAQLER